MILKIFRGVWFISLLVVVANLMYVYAGLPEEVIIHKSEGSPYVISKEVLFYSWLALIGVVNLLVYVFGRSLAPDEGFRTWFTGLIISLNTFFIIGFSFIGLYNSHENFDFSRIDIVLYFGIALVCVWITSWPIVLLVRRFQRE
jgi:hypothetical protein